MSMTRLEIAQKVAELRKLHVSTERDVEFRSQLARLLQVDETGAQIPEPVRHAGGLEARGIALIDGAGGGKTTCIRRSLSSNSALSPPGAPAHFIQLQVPSPATLKSLGLEILRATGFTGVAERATAWQIWNTVRHRLSVCGVVALWIDEAHDLFQSKGEGEIDDMLNMLKSLMQGESAVIVILSGTHRLSEITARDPQVDRRFTKVVPQPLIPGASEAHVAEIVTHYAGLAGLEVAWADALPGRLIHASRHRFGRMIETVISAIEQALTEGQPTLTRMHFAQAWGIQEGCAWDDNVFIARDWAARDPDARAEEFESGRVAKLKSRRGK